MPGEDCVPVLIYLTDRRAVNQVVWAYKHINSFTDLAGEFYAKLQPNIPEFYLEAGERSITQMWVDWNNPNDFFPRETEITDDNVKEVLALIEQRRGQDMIRVWLNDIE